MDIKILIVDDELHARLLIASMLEEICKGKFEIVGSCASVDEAMLVLEEKPVDLVFLDIHMPGKNGFEFLNLTKQYTFEVVFVTAYDKYAIQAFNAAALHYILKPFDIEQLQFAMDRYQGKIFRHKDTQEQYNEVIAAVEEKRYPKNLCIRTKTTLEVISIDSIVCVEVSGNYLEINLDDGTQNIVLKTLKEVEECLSPDLFFRVHRRSLLRLSAVVKYDGKKKEAYLPYKTVKVASRNESLFLSRIIEDN